MTTPIVLPEATEEKLKEKFLRKFSSHKGDIDLHWMWSFIRFDILQEALNEQMKAWLNFRIKESGLLTGLLPTEQYKEWLEFLKTEACALRAEEALKAEDSVRRESRHTGESDLKNKILQIAAEICELHASVAGKRVCQDWSGDQKLLDSLSDKEKDFIAKEFEDFNSNGDEYEEGFFPEDEMYLSFVCAFFLRKFSSEAPVTEDKKESLKKSVGGGDIKIIICPNCSGSGWEPRYEGRKECHLCEMSKTVELKKKNNSPEPPAPVAGDWREEMKESTQEIQSTLMLSLGEAQNITERALAAQAKKHEEEITEARRHLIRDLDLLENLRDKRGITNENAISQLRKFLFS